MPMGGGWGGGVGRGRDVLKKLLVHGEVASPRSPHPSLFFYIYALFDRKVTPSVYH